MRDDPGPGVTNFIEVGLQALSEADQHVPMRKADFAGAHPSQLVEAVG